MQIQEVINLIIALVSFVGAISALYRIAHIADTKTFKLLQEDNQRLQTENKDLESRLVKLENDHLSDREKMIGLEATVRDLTATRDTLLTSNGVLQKTVEDQNKVIVAYTQQIQETQAEVKAERVRRLEVMERFEKLGRDMNGMQLERDALRISNAQLQQQLDQRVVEMEKLSARIYDLEHPVASDGSRAIPAPGG